jgi:hypothetical protein
MLYWDNETSTRCRNCHNILPLFGRLEGSFTFSPFLSYTMKHTHTSQKATMARGWERDEWVLTSPPSLRVLFIGKLMTKLPLWLNTTRNGKVGVEECDAARRIDLSIFDFISTWPPWWFHMHHPCRASTSLEARLGNANLTRFQAKQAARSQRVPHAIFIVPIDFVA